MKKLITSILLTSVVACGGGSDKDGSNSATETYPKNAPTLNDIVGMWDDSEVIDGSNDVKYTAIRADSTVDLFDYMGDEYDNIENCYSINPYGEFQFTDLGDGQFDMHLDNIDFGNGVVASSSYISQFTMPNADTLEIKSVQQYVSVTYLGDNYFTENITVLDTNHVNIDILEEGQQYNITLSRVNESNEWSADNGYYYDMDYLYSMASMMTVVYTTIRTDKTESDFTPVCTDMAPTNPLRKNPSLLSPIQHKLERLTY